MEGVLKKKREELQQLEKDQVDLISKTALGTVTEKVRNDGTQQSFERVQSMFSEKLKSIELATYDHYNWAMTNRLEGGNNDVCTLFTVSFNHTPATLVCTYNQRREC